MKKTEFKREMKKRGFLNVNGYGNGYTFIQNKEKGIYFIPFALMEQIKDFEELNLKDYLYIK
jgi:hypothetical protein